MLFFPIILPCITAILSNQNSEEKIRNSILNQNRINPGKYFCKEYDILLYQIVRRFTTFRSREIKF